MIKLKVSEKEKYKEEGEWFKKAINEIVPYHLALNEDYQMMLNSYKVVNNDLSGFRQQLTNFCHPLGVEVDEVEEQVLPYPELRNKVNILKGEMLSRKDTFHVILLSARAIREKNDELLNEIKASIDEKVAIDIKKMEMQMQGMSKEQQDQFVKELRTKREPEDLVSTNYLSEVEVFFSKGTQYCEYNQDILDKKSQTMEDAVIVDRCFVYSGWRNGKPHLEVRNPLRTGFHKNPDERYVQNADWIWYTKPVTLADATESYNLSKEDQEKLNTSVSITKAHNIFGHDSKYQFNLIDKELMLSTNSRIANDKTKGLNQAPNNTLRGYVDLVWETHFEFKAFKEIIFLSYRDEYNKQVVIPMSSDFEIPKNAKKEKFLNRFDQDSERYVWFDKIMGTEFTAERIWIPRKYEIVRLGHDVYPIFREVPYQYVNVEDPFSTFTMSTFGAIFNARNTSSVSLVQNALQPYFQLLYIKHIQNRELSKYQGAIQAIDVDQIPDQLGQDINGEEIRDKIKVYLKYLKTTNKDFYSGSQGTLGGLPPSTRSPGSSGYQIGTAVELMNLQQLLELVKREISMAMGISPQREANFVTGSNVTDNQQAINQSYAITEPYFFTHAQIWKAAINDWLINFRQYCQIQMEVHNLKDLSFHYWLPDNTEQVLRVTPKSLSHADIGLFLVNSTATQKYADMMVQYAQAFAQNAGEGISAVSGILKDIVMQASPEEIHKRIVIEEQKQHDRQAQLEQMKIDAQKQQQQKELEWREDNQRHEIEKIVTKEVENRITRLQEATITAVGFNENKDMDSDGVPDIIEIMNHGLKQEKLSLDIKTQKDNVRLKEEELELKRKALNKKPTK